MDFIERILEHQSQQETSAVCLPHITGALRANIAMELALNDRRPVIIANHEEDAETLFSDLCFMSGVSVDQAASRGLYILSADEQSPYEEHSSNAQATAERINTLYRLAKDPNSIKALVITPNSLVRRHISPKYLSRFSEYLVSGEEIDRSYLAERLCHIGYNPVSSVEDPGTFSVRGGIVDIYSPHNTLPMRLDLFGDEIESIYLFDPSTQRNQRKLEDAVILPAREISFDQEAIDKSLKLVAEVAEKYLIPSRKLNATIEDINNKIYFFGIESLLPVFHSHPTVGLDEYLPKNTQNVFIYQNTSSLVEYSDNLWAKAQIDFERTLQQHRLALPPKEHYVDIEQSLDKISKQAHVIEIPDVQLSDNQANTRVEKIKVPYEATDTLRTEILRLSRNKEEETDILSPLVDRLKKWKSKNTTSFIACHTRGQAERLLKMFEGRNVQIRLHQQPFSIAKFQAALEPHEAFKRRETTLKDKSTHAWIVVGEISNGFALHARHLAFISEEEIFGQRTKRKTRRTRPKGKDISSLGDLQDNDFIVHADFGIGKYLGMTKLAINGVDADYLHIEYRGGDKLYLPVHRLRLIQKFVGAGEGKGPALDKLGGTTWANTKQKVKDHLLKMAAELLRLYAARKSLVGYAFPSPDESYQQFEAEFPYEPTPDQGKAIEDVLVDLQKSSPMDRLICGDVGYGKTEVAMRATMMAVVAGKQTAVLVPTTVLAAQHFQVFSNRFKNFGVNIGITSRFQNKEETRKVTQDLKEGKIDIVIGTHRLLSKDIQFKNLGLVVVDEEHRFGVSHKEKLKKYRSSIHVLSMSATPIPRTLHMGFMGVRDMSIIATPPEDRLAVKTEVHRFSESTIAEALKREIQRGGQAFVVHNRVSSITALASLIERLVPESRVAIGHGQMAQDRLEKIMVDFMNKEYNVLLSTTIVESGIDIPNANTIIINRADRMGLAQLYQLKGRVGRGNQRGYAHFLIPAGNLSPKARKRISVLQRFTELGGGFKVASHDLEIRGAGNILGKQQSGSIGKVGFDMYQALLQEAIAEIKGSKRIDSREPEIQLPVTALIPDSYIPDPGQRLSVYQRFNAAEDDATTYDLLQEISDLNGRPPPELENLTRMMLVKQRCYRIGIVNLDYAPKTKAMDPRLVVRFDPERPKITPSKLVSYVQKKPHYRKVLADSRLLLTLEPFETEHEILEQAKSLLDQLILA